MPFVSAALACAVAAKGATCLTNHIQRGVQTAMQSLNYLCIYARSRRDLSLSCLTCSAELITKQELFTMVTDEQVILLCMLSDVVRLAKSFEDGTSDVAARRSGLTFIT